MLDLLKRLVLFAIGLYLVLFVAKTIFGEFSLTKLASDITGALKQFQTIGKLGSDGNVSGNSNITTTKGEEYSVQLVNLSRGNMVHPGDVIDGSAPGKWFYQGVSTMRFYNENGTEIGVSQMLARGDYNTSAKVPFIATVQFQQGGAQTGYVSFENANPSGDPKTAVRFVLPITYPVDQSQYRNQSTSSAGVTATGGITAGAPTSITGTTITNATRTTTVSGQNTTTQTNTNTNSNTNTNGTFGGTTVPAPR